MTFNPSSNSAPSRSDRTQWQFTPLALPGVILVAPPVFGDARGWLSETYNARIFSAHGIDLRFVQDNVSFSAEIGTVRGLHYQLPPFAQDKLVRVVSGRILDVAVDIREHSPTFGKHVAVELSAENWRQLLVPAGFAHGFITRTANTIVAYKVTNFYAPDYDRGINWTDPALKIAWEIGEAEATLSSKDKDLPLLQDAARFGMTEPSSESE
ncbi:MAG: dTDP-4-dehydrorhamnose 3,5-epimerase [Alphaproteobacteria bacterium]